MEHATMRYAILLASGFLALLLAGLGFAPPAEARGYRCGQCGTVEDVDRIWYEGRRDRGTGGAVLGAIIGGALGNQVGKGDGRKAATVAGAVIGGSIGHNQATRGDRYEGVERRCRIIEDYREERRLVGYDVEYRYRGEVYMSRLDYDPGDKLRVRVSVAPAD